VVNHSEWLFLSILDDLDTKTAHPDKYGLIKASGLLRQLLLDENPLVIQVNRAYKLNLVFTFRALPKIGQDDLIVAWMRLPKGNNPCDVSQATTAGLSTFLGAGCLGLAGRVFTVREVILANAHVKGGVHAGRSRDGGVAGVVVLDQILNVGGAEASLATLRDIISVTLEGVKPLAEAVRNANR
jgi:hypothetical protein